MASIPSWAIALVSIIVIIIASCTVYLIFRKRIGKKRTTVGTQEEGSVLEKSTSAYPIKPLTQLHNTSSKNNSNTTIPYNTANDNDNVSSFCTEDIKINLPLPPPSSSFFADKMELDSTEANDIYNSYLTSQQDYVSIDLDDSKPFLSSAAATIQQKTATIRSNLRQSMRRKSTSNKSGGVTPLNHFFENVSDTSLRSSTKSPAESTRMSRQSSSTSSRFPRSPVVGQQTIPSLPTPAVVPLPSPRPDSTSEYFSRNSSKKSLLVREEDNSNSSNKLMIDTIPPDSYFSLPPGIKTVTPPSPFPETTITATVDKNYSMTNETRNETYDDDDDDDDDSQHSNEDNQQPSNGNDSPLKAASAARKIIRSASRKSRTRSMIVTDEATQAMFSNFANGKVPSTPKPSSVSNHATLRGLSKKPSAIAVDIKDWTPTHNKVGDITAAASPSSPSPKRTLMSSTLSGSATVSGRKALKLQQLSISGHQGSSSSDNATKSATLGKKSGFPAASTSPKSLRHLFSHPSQDESRDIVQKSTPSSDATSLSIVTTDIDHHPESAPDSPITVEAASPYASKNSTLCKVGNNVDTIRRMLQSSWSGNNLNESGSCHSLSLSSVGDRTSSYMGSVGSSYLTVASPLGSVNPRLQNQHLVSLSLKASTSQPTRSRPSMPIGFMNHGTNIEGGGVGGPAPTASFSSSTVRTMIPADEAGRDQQSRLNTLEKKSSTIGLLAPRQLQPFNLASDTKKQQHQSESPAQKERKKYLESLKA